ncbi:phage virion morphogenesis protein [Comamonas sp. w2-DMI]|uniref:phage virion morphogenesis protein n=1 Tax=Comamonadaceae TaxID=80864 RepID=UPI0032D8C4EF
MADDLQRLSDWVAPLLHKLQPAERRQLARQVAVMLRRENQRSIAAQHGPLGEAWAPRKSRSRDQRGKLRAGSMFRKLRTARHLRAQTFTDATVLRFVGYAQRIAQVHHFGLQDKVSKTGAQYNSPPGPCWASAHSRWNCCGIWC